jgi:polyisoprenoid-binding protein YceI
MKPVNNKMLMIALMIFSGILIAISCTHKNEVLPASASTTVVITHGNHIHLSGLTAGDTSQWKFDKQHSAVNWSSPFEGVGAPLTGKFNQFGLADISSPSKQQTYTTAGQPMADTSWAFYENQPSKTHFSGYVQLNQVNTGEPGRDGGCLVSTFGTTAIVAGTQNLLVSNVALIKSTSVEFDPLSNNYIATFNFTWQGKLAAPLTESIVGKLTYVPETTAGTHNEFGLHLEFQINCRDFGITSTSVADVIMVTVNANFNNQ